MQEQPQRKSPRTNIDGFISNRPHRTVGFSDARLRHSIHAKSTPVTNVPIHRPVGRNQTPSGSINAGADPLAVHRAGVGRPLSQAFVDKAPKGKRRFGFFGPRKNKDSNKPPAPTWKRVTKRSALVMVALFVLCGGWLGWKVYRNTAKVFGNNNPLHVLSAFKTVKLKGEDTGHVNILLAGDSADRTDGDGGSDLTDSIMIVSIDVKNHAASMISIPRDTWVNIPGYGHAKINETYQDGQNSKFAGGGGFASGGMGLLEKVISQNFGITPNYYALVNYTAFKQAVNDVGGIDVNIQSPDPRGLYDPSFKATEGAALKLPNGVDHLNGQTALDLARARGDPYNGVYGAYGFPNSDFDRTEHQRQMLIALKQKITTAGVISNPVKIGNLMDAIGNNIKTDFQLDEVTSLYTMMKKIDSNAIKSVSLNSADGKNLLGSYTTPSGQSALIPAAGLDNFSDIQAFIAKTITNNQIVKEAANVVILNGGNIVGLAKQEQTALAAKGVTVSTVADAPTSYATTTTIDNSNGKMPNTKKFLGSTFGTNYSTDATVTKTYPNANFIVILGANQAAPQSTSTTSTDSTSASSTD